MGSMGIAEVSVRRFQEGISEMQLCHTSAGLSVAFDEPNLIACAGLVPSVGLADRIGLRDLADEWLTVPGSRGTAGAKVMSLVAGMLAGADSIDDLDLLRHGGMDKVFADLRAPSTLGRSCAGSPSGTCGSSTRSPPGR